MQDNLIDEVKIEKIRDRINLILKEYPINGLEGAEIAARLALDIGASIYKTTHTWDDEDPHFWESIAKDYTEHPTLGSMLLLHSRSLRFLIQRIRSINNE